MRGIDQGCPGIEPDGDRQRVHQLLARGPGLGRRLGMNGDARVAPGRGRHGQTDQLPRLVIQGAMGLAGRIERPESVHDLGIPLGQIADRLDRAVHELLPINGHKASRGRFRAGWAGPCRPDDLAVLS